MRKFDYFRRYMKMAPDDGGGGGASSSTPSPSGDGGGASVSPAQSADGGGNGPTSPASPSAPDSGGSPTPSAPDANPWDALGSVDDLDSIEIPPQPAAVAAPPAEAPPVAPPAATPPVAPTAQQPTPTAQPQQPTQPSAPSAPELSPADPAGIATAMAAARNDVIAHLAQDRFALTPEDIQELETDAAAFVPKMMARVMFEAQTSMMKFLAQSVPGMIQKHTRVTAANSEAESKFFDAHKALGLDAKNPQHREVAFRMASLYRQANPQMPLEQLIAEVGPVVAASLRANGHLAQTPAAPSTPTAAPRGGTPFRPAVNGGGGASPAPAQANEWAGLGMNFDE